MAHEDLIEALAVRLHQGCPLCTADPDQQKCALMLGCREQARLHSTAIVEAGWRILRTEPVRPTKAERDWRVIQEWTP